MAPSLVASYDVYSSGVNSSTLTTSAFTPSNGEVLVVKLATWDTAHGMNAPTGGAQTYSAIGIAAPGGFNGWCAVYTATVSGSPGSMTVSATTDGTNTQHSMVVERWSGATLAGSPATNATKNGSGSTTATTTLTTTADNSVVSWCLVDELSRDPAASSYVTTSGTPTQDGLWDGHIGSNNVHYYAYQDAATAGSQTFGITNASTLTWVAVGVEVQAAAAAVTGDVSQTVTAASTVTAANAAPGDVSQTATAASTVTGANSAPGAVASTVTATATAAAAWTATTVATDTTTATATVTATIAGETTATGSWYQLMDIMREASDLARDERSRDPKACPNDGEPLVEGPGGQLFCRFDGWRPGQ